MPETRLFRDRQRVHVGTQADASPATAVTQRTDHPGAGNPFVHL
jgi:hypothetical protein